MKVVELHEQRDKRIICRLRCHGVYVLIIDVVHVCPAASDLRPSAVQEQPVQRAEGPVVDGSGATQCCQPRVAPYAQPCGR